MPQAGCSFVILIKPYKMIVETEAVSTFALMVDKLRTMDEAQLKLAYIKLFSDEINKEWESITSRANFGDISDEEIISRMEKRRYEAA